MEYARKSFQGGNATARGITAGSVICAVMLSFVFVLAHAGVAEATLQLLKPNPSIPATFVGRGGYSADGLGQEGTGGTVQADVPAGSTVVRAYLYGTYFSNTNPDETARTINFDGNNVVLEFLTNSEPGPCCALATARAEVTSQVAGKVGSGGGITDFAINNDPPTLDGVALVVIFANESLADGTIAILDGGSRQEGDSTRFDFAAPLDTTVPNFGAQLSLGSGFSFQGAPGNVCGGDQFSTVAVNTMPLTSCAGNYDDGLGRDGALITVGGVGDSIENPTPPDNPPTDDELYNLAPFMNNGDTSLVIDTTNPSGDDNLFLAVISFAARVAGTVEICDNGQDEDGDGLVDLADSDCPKEAPKEVCGLTLDGADQKGTDGNDSLTGTERRDRIKGGGGRDRITGLAGDDCLFGQDDPDNVKGNAGGDLIRAGDGNDKLNAGPGDDRLRAQDGDDKVKGGSGDDFLKVQGRGTDNVNCGSGTDRVIGDVKDTISKNCEKVKIVDPA